MRMIVALLAALAVILAIWRLEGARAGLAIERQSVGATPVTVYRQADAPPAPVVVLAHGFAGSRQLMEAYALTLAQAGYVAVSFDFEGHGRNPVPMSGDVTRIDGTTRKLMAETGRVIDHALALPYADGRVALLGHSMASDIIVRQAIADPRVGAVIAISMFSEATTARQPHNLLMITGEWEGFLRSEALKTLRQVDPEAEPGEIVGRFADGTARRAVVAPSAEHVAVLYAPTGLHAARDWLDRAFGGETASAHAPGGAPVAATGPWILLLLGGIAALAWPAARALPAGDGSAVAAPPLKPFLAAALAPAILTPLALAPFETRLLPVLVADYLALHLALYAFLALAILWRAGAGFGRPAWAAGLALAAYAILIFGGALDRYAASFLPSAERLPIILAIAAGAIPFMIADSLLAGAGRAPLWRVLIARAAFLASLLIAVALDRENLFFLLMILPVIVIFYAVFGAMGGWVGRRTGSALAAGFGMGLTLAWAIGATFPLFSQG